METKKSLKANMEKNKNIFFQTGVIISMVLVILAFEWKLFERPDLIITNQRTVFYDIDEIPIIQKDEVLPLPPPSQTFEIVDDEIEDLPEIDINADIGIYDPVQPVFIFDNTEEPFDENVVFIAVQEFPEFPGGEAARLSFLKEKLRYPVLAAQLGIQGTVIVTFVVERDGSISNVSVLRGIGGGCDEEAIRVTKLMPKWKPGIQYNQPVRTQFSMPIKYELKR